MTKEKTADETENDETTSEEEVPSKEVDQVKGSEEVIGDGNKKHAKPLFTGNLGGHVLLDSETSPDGGALMGSALGTPSNGIPGASQFAALVPKHVG